MKKNKEIIYSENQTFYLVLIPFLTVILLLMILSYLYLGNKPIPIEITFVSVVFFIIIILLFYKMNVKINKQHINISFGVGIINKKILISDIDFESIKKIKINWYYGIGIRMIKNGWLYNTKIGEAIKFKTDKKIFAIGTSNYTKIYDILQKMKNY